MKFDKNISIPQVEKRLRSTVQTQVCLSRVGSKLFSCSYPMYFPSLHYPVCLFCIEMESVIWGLIAIINRLCWWDSLLVFFFADSINIIFHSNIILSFSVTACAIIIGNLTISTSKTKLNPLEGRLLHYEAIYKRTNSIARTCSGFI